MRLRLFKPVRVERVEDITRVGFKILPTTYRVRATVRVKGRERSFHLIEHVFPPSASHQPLHYYKVSNALRRIGINVPTVRLKREARREYRCFVSDLAKLRGRKFDVRDWARESGAITWATGLANFEEIKRYIDEKNIKAKEAGYIIEPRAWKIAVDPQTHSGTPYVADFKHVYEKGFYESMTQSSKKPNE